MSAVSMEATIILPILKKKLAFLSGSTHAHAEGRWVGLWFSEQTTSQHLVFERRQRPAQRSDPDHPPQFRSDQHGGAQCHFGLPAQHPKVRLVCERFCSL